MTTIVRVIKKKNEDVLGYDEPRLVDRIRHMAGDAIAGVNQEAVDAEVARVGAFLRNRSA